MKLDPHELHHLQDEEEKKEKEIQISTEDSIDRWLKEFKENKSL